MNRSRSLLLVSWADEVLLAFVAAACHRVAFVEVHALDHWIVTAGFHTGDAVLFPWYRLVSSTGPAGVHVARSHVLVGWISGAVARSGSRPQIESSLLADRYYVAHGFRCPFFDRCLLDSVLCPVPVLSASVCVPAGSSEHFGRFARSERGARLHFWGRTKLVTSVGTAESSHGPREVACIRALSCLPGMFAHDGL